MSLPLSQDGLTGYQRLYAHVLNVALRARGKCRDLERRAMERLEAIQAIIEARPVTTVALDTDNFVQQMAMLGAQTIKTGLDIVRNPKAVYRGILQFGPKAYMADRASTYLALSSLVSTLDTTHLRDVFEHLEFEDLGGREFHTHGKSANWRTSFLRAVEEFCTHVGMIPFHYQMSLSQQRKLEEGSRSYHWSKDVHLDPVQFNDDLTDHHLMVLTDVDYYVDMVHFLTTQFRPFMLYTLQPEAASAVREEYSYKFNPDGTIHYIVTGGGQYRHYLWDWQVDSLKLTEEIMGIPVRVSCFHVIKRDVNQDHQAVLLIPDRQWLGVSAMAAEALVSGPKLERKSFVHGDFVKLEIRREREHLLSIARVDQYPCATLPIEIVQALENIPNLQKQAVSLSTIRSHAPDDFSKASAVILLAYIRSTITDERVTTRYPVAMLGCHEFHRVSKHLTTDSEPYRVPLLPFMNCLLSGGYVAADTPSNSAWAIKSRITDLAVDKKPSANMKTFAAEFIAILIPDSEAHRAHPYDPQVVWERQTRPSQQAILDRADMMGDNYPNVVNSFIKPEANQALKPPRVISTIPGVSKLLYSAFMYSFADLLKTQPWYGFAKTPKEIAERVSWICSTVADAYVALTDFSRQDARVSLAARYLEEAAFMRFFQRKYAKQIYDLLRSQYNCIAYDKHENSYHTGVARLSGSPETSAFNTLLNAFSCYVGYRMMGKPVGEAWESLGMYGGDDGITADLDPDCIRKAGNMTGQKITLEIRLKGQSGVNFLSRFYSQHVWWGNPTSMCDLNRQLVKFHMSKPLLELQRIQKLEEKLRGLAATDRNTPVFRELIKAFERISGRQLTDIEPDEWIADLHSWWARYDSSVQYPNTPHDDFEDMVGKLNLELTPLKEYLNEATTLEQLLLVPGVRETHDDDTMPPAPDGEHYYTVDDLLLDPPVIAPENKEDDDDDETAAINADVDGEVPTVPRPDGEVRHSPDFYQDSTPKFTWDPAEAVAHPPFSELAQSFTFGVPEPKTAVSEDEKVWRETYSKWNLVDELPHAPAKAKGTEEGATATADHKTAKEAKKRRSEQLKKSNRHNKRGKGQAPTKRQSKK